eukprot:GHVH01001985.1.p1 GENE.GHVH01001985.1~~GHVH01001985.1.p1  ORF type:complete len:397 (+),score=65.66 GHVH01001985.1:64-1254(+)
MPANKEIELVFEIKMYRAKDAFGRFSLRTGVFITEVIHILASAFVFLTLHFLRPLYKNARVIVIVFSSVSAAIGMIGTYKRSVRLTWLYFVLLAAFLAFQSILIADLIEVLPCFNKNVKQTPAAISATFAKVEDAFGKTFIEIDSHHIESFINKDKLDDERSDSQFKFDREEPHKHHGIGNKRRELQSNLNNRLEPDIGSGLSNTEENWHQDDLLDEVETDSGSDSLPHTSQDVLNGHEVDYDSGSDSSPHTSQDVLNGHEVDYDSGVFGGSSTTPRVELVPEVDVPPTTTEEIEEPIKEQELSSAEMPQESVDMSTGELANFKATAKMQKRVMQNQFYAPVNIIFWAILNYGFWLVYSFAMNRCSSFDELMLEPDQFHIGVLEQTDDQYFDSNHV